MDSDNRTIGALIDHGYRIVVYCEAHPAFGKRFGFASDGYFAQAALFKMRLTSVPPDDTEAHARWVLLGTDILYGSCLIMSAWPVLVRCMVPSLLHCQTW
jgi:hypothetical protein